MTKRVIILLTFVDGVLFRTKQFVPDYRYTQSFLALDNADEVMMVDVTPGAKQQDSFIRVVREYVERAHLPVTAGGGISSMSETKRLFEEAGADRVVIGPRYSFLPVWIAEHYGAQAIVQALNHGCDTIIDEPQIVAGAELLVNSIDRDGSLEGYDLPMLRACADQAPIIAAGGCGTWGHMAEAFEAGAVACATSCIFHFTDPTLASFKRNLAAAGHAVRPAI